MNQDCILRIAAFLLVAGIRMVFRPWGVRMVVKMGIRFMGIMETLHNATFLRHISLRITETKIRTRICNPDAMSTLVLATTFHLSRVAMRATNMKSTLHSMNHYLHDTQWNPLVGETTKLHSLYTIEVP